MLHGALRYSITTYEANIQSSVIHRRACVGGVDIARLLIAQGADVDAASDNDFRAIHFAALYGRRDLAEILVTAGADTLAAAGETGLPFLMTLTQCNKEG